jgi:predicted lactoylglutathione lyase
MSDSFKTRAAPHSIFIGIMTRRELLLSLAAAPFIHFATGEIQKMEQRISVVTLGVKDLAASRKFYVEGLGWKAAFENEEIIFFQAGGMIFALFPRDKLAEDFHGDPASLGGRAAISLGYNVHAKAEVDPLIQRAAAGGAKILKAGEEASWGGYSGYFADPDGVAWEVAWNPGWSLDAKGNVTIR